MIYINHDIPIRNSTKREVAFVYDTNNADDLRVKKLIEELLKKEQKSCEQCKHFKHSPYFCGYSESYCAIKGSLEGLDASVCLDGSLCSDFVRKKEEG